MPPLIYGHRGTRRGAPENSLAAIRLALDQGADGVEIDVRLCGSGEPVVLHDPDLLRVAGIAEDVAKLSLPELLRCDLGGGERVPRLQDALEWVLDAGAVLNIELKPDVPDAVALIRAVVAELQRRPGAELQRVLLSSFSPSMCRMLSAALPDVAVALLFDRAPAEAPPGSRALHPHHALATPEHVQRWHAAGLLVNVWTVNDPERARALVALGVDGIITDDVPQIAAAVRPAPS